MELDAATLERIYCGGLVSPPWQDAVDLFCDKLGAIIMVLAFRVYEGELPSIGVQSFRCQGRAIWEAYFAQFRNVSTFDYAQLQPCQIHALEEFSHAGRSDVALLRRELHAPYGAGETYCLPLAHHGRVVAYLIWMMTANRPLDDAQAAWCRAAAVPLGRAVDGFNRMRLSELSGRLATEALSSLKVGVVALDREDRILFRNRVADRLIAESPDLGSSDGRLILTRPEVAARFAGGGAQSLALRVRGGFEATIGLLVSPVLGGQDELGPESRPTRVVYLRRLVQSAHIPERLLGELFGLSDTEARLCALLCEGYSLREAAGQLGVTENTVRSYSKLVFSKVGVSRQVDLVNALLTSVAIFGNDAGG
jgi:DNA-binding CsgD family transcriptional regulator/PAS domain-containing protein